MVIDRPNPELPFTEDDIAQAEAALNGDEAINWGRSEADLASVSTKWPPTRFIMDCSAEDGEKWRVYCRNGQWAHAKYVPPPFDAEWFSKNAIQLAGR